MPSGVQGWIIKDFLNWMRDNGYNVVYSRQRPPRQLSTEELLEEYDQYKRSV